MTPHTPFDKVAQSHWQAYQQGKGDMAYKERLGTLLLDGSMDSLKALDTLLLAIKDDIIKQAVNEVDCLQQSAFRNFMLFVSFYVGRVVKHQHGIDGSWLDVGSLKERYSLNTSAGKFYSVTAFAPHQGQGVSDLPFFVLMVLGAKLFGDSRQFTHPMTGQSVPTSLYWATLGYVDDVKQVSQINPIIPSKPTPSETTPSEPTKEPISTPKPSFKKSSLPPNAAQRTVQAPSQAKTVQLQAKAKNLTEVKSDLVNLAAAATAHQSAYQKAMAVIDKVAKLIDNNPDALARLTAKQQHVLNEAITLLTKVATAGNTNAMISLALCYFEGVGVPVNDVLGFEWVQKAANMNDVRAQKLLSRLYYQGIGTNPSTELGKLWLSRAADNGHSEAKKLQAQFTHIEFMQEDIKAEIEQDKKYLIWGGFIAAVLVVVLWAFAKLINNS